MFELRPKQKEIIVCLRQAWKDYRTHIIYAPTGMGKTAVAYHIVKGFHDNGLKVLFVAPYTMLVEQTADRFMGYGLPQPGIIWQNHEWTDPHNLIQIASADTLIRRELPEFDVMLVDECFPAGTLVDGRPIEEIKEGDYVTSFDEVSGKFNKNKVLCTSKKKINSSFVSICAKPHIKVKCTKDHPFYTKRGWIKACDITTEDEILIYDGIQRNDSAMQHMREKIPFIDEAVLSLARSWCCSLLKNLLGRVKIQSFKKNRRKICQDEKREDEKKQPHEKQKDKGEDVGNTGENRAQAKSSRREWQGANRARKENNGGVVGFGVQVSGGDKDRPHKRWIRLSDMLQGGFGKLFFEIGDRGRRGESQRFEEERAGQEEKRFSHWERVDSVEIQELNCRGRLGVGDKEDFVYNLHVENDNTYIANSVVVHNCHMKRKKLLEVIRDTDKPVIGLTATPYPKWMGTYYENLIKVTSLKEQIDTGYLCDYEFYAPSKPNLKGARTSNLAAYGTDYNEQDIADIMGDAQIMGDIVNFWMENGQNLPTVAFCCNVAHANFVTTEFNKAGVKAEVMTAETPKEERRRIVDRFESGITKIICNVGVLVAGFDSDIRCIIYARPTKSEIRWMQVLGRGLRTAKGKDKCLIFDHSGTIFTLGEPIYIEYDELLAKNDGMKSPQQIRQEKEKKEKIPKECPKCHFMKPAGKNKCPKCGFAPLGGEDVEVRDGKLVKIRGGEQSLTKKDKELFWRQLRGYAVDQSYRGKNVSRGHLAHIFKKKFGHWPSGLSDEPLACGAEVRNYVKSYHIAWIKSQEKFKKQKRGGGNKKAKSTRQMI